jgi:hypothetical protein
MRRRKRGTGDEPVKCEDCSRPTSTPRKGKCWACYFRDYRGHALSGPCSVCGEADRRVLRRHKLADVDTVLCANHAAIAGRRVLTAAELAAECFPAGDRRQTGRRSGDRRAVSARRERDGDAWLLGNATEHRSSDGRRIGDG